MENPVFLGGKSWKIRCFYVENHGVSGVFRWKIMENPVFLDGKSWKIRCF